MTAVSIVWPKFTAWDSATGAPLAGGKVYFYEPGTTTPKTTWADEAKVATNTNPVILNGAGFAAIHLDGSYRVVLTDANDVAVWTADPVSSVASDSELAAINTALDLRLDALEDLASERFTYNLRSNEDPQVLDLSTYLAVGTQTGRFYYDPADGTTVHDGITCVVDTTGRRFKRANVDINAFDERRTAPPVSPAAGEVYLVAAPATGGFAGQEDKIAVYTNRGLLFADPQVSSRYDKSLGGYRTFDETDTWVRGIGWLPDPPQSAMGIVVQEELSTPAVSPTDGQRWLVGASPTGAWAGKAKSIATWIAEDSEWAFLAPYEGAQVYDRDVSDASPEAGVRTYTGGAWSAVPAAPTLPGVAGYTLEGTVDTLALSASGTVTFPAGDWLILTGEARAYNTSGGTISVQLTKSGADLTVESGAVSILNQPRFVWGIGHGGDEVTLTAGASPGTETVAAYLRITIAKLTAVT